MTSEQDAPETGHGMTHAHSADSHAGERGIDCGDSQSASRRSAIVALVGAEFDGVNEVDSELREVYNQEADDHLQNIYQGLQHLEDDLGNREVLQGVRRSAHTLKGAADVEEGDPADAATRRVARQ